jgi:putative glutamine amidotransferase
MTRPIVLIPACARQSGSHISHTVQTKYADAVVYGAGCAPLILPALGDKTDWDTVLATADGIMLTGSPSNVHPSHFGQPVRNPSLPLDPARDATTLPLIRAALERGIALLAICRGAQEVNVALGGSLHQAVQEVDSYMDHREDMNAPLDVQYGPAHCVKITPGGCIASILGDKLEIMVNSLHGQGVDRLAPGLQVEAVADDGLVEAYRVDAPGFALALQWHPEWRITENPDSMKLFAAFGEACRQYRAKRTL